MTIMTLSRFVAHFRACFPDLMGRRALVALSGGADSVALLVLLHQSMRELSLSLCAAHVHHHLRSEEADEDASWCAQLCERLRVPFQVLHLHEPTPPRGVSPEAWWRRERYRLLAGEAGRTGCVAVLTAHTLDDQAETVLLKLLAGAGPRGVAGIRPRVGVVVRPLLEMRRADLRTFLEAAGGVWREDPTNQDARRPRAWVRHRLLPLLEARFPRASEHLASLASDVARDEELLGELLARSAPWPRIGESFPVMQLRQLPETLLVRWTLQIASGLPLREPPSRAQLKLVSAMIHGGKPAAVDLGRRWVLRRRGDYLCLLPPPCPPFEPRPAGRRVTLPGGWRATLGGTPEPQASYQVWLDPRILAASPVWRPLGRGEGWPEAGWKSLARALAAAGVPAPWRAAWPVLEAGGSIVWVPAVGVAVAWAGTGEAGVAATLEEPWQRRWK